MTTFLFNRAYGLVQPLKTALMKSPDRARCPVIAAGPDPHPHARTVPAGHPRLDNVTDVTRTGTDDFRSLDRLFGTPTRHSSSNAVDNYLVCLVPWSRSTSSFVGT